MCFGNRKNGKKIFTFLNKISIQAGNRSERDGGNVPRLTAAHEVMRAVRTSGKCNNCVSISKLKEYSMFFTALLSS